jgi:predicted small integral membrane protein
MRLVQTVVTALLGLYLALVAFTNMTDYGTNFQFVEKVLGMYDTFHTQSWRAITWPPLVHACYITIIAWEAATALVCGWAAWQMYRYLHAPSDIFQHAKNLGLKGLLMGFVLWTGVFLCFGGEWFLMWQSEKWNGQDVAAKMAILYGMGLLLLKD